MYVCSESFRGAFYVHIWSYFSFPASFEYTSVQFLSSYFSLITLFHLSLKDNASWVICPHWVQITLGENNQLKTTVSIIFFCYICLVITISNLVLGRFFDRYANSKEQLKIFLIKTFALLPINIFLYWVLKFAIDLVYWL